MNYQSSIQASGDQAELLKDRLTPKAIVAALDEHIIGQDDAKRAVAVALRNRWRRQQLSPELRDEVTPKNILMIGPTGCGKTEISRRLAKLADAPFVKVEATKFTEVGYVGRDVEQIARDLLEEADKRVDPDDINRVALADAESNGIVLLDEIDKIAVSDVRGGSVSREGVQRDLLPLIEGTTVATKYGPLKTDHILFIASGAFHMAKPADLLPELQGRLPIRVELQALTQQDFVRILSATRASLTEQYQALLGTEGVTITFADDGIEALARIAAEVNEAVENIGARRLQTVMEKLLEDVSFDAEDRRGTSLVVDAAFVDQQLSGIARNADLSRYVL